MYIATRLQFYDTMYFNTMHCIKIHYTLNIGVGSLNMAGGSWNVGVDRSCVCVCMCKLLVLWKHQFPHLYSRHWRNKCP